MPAQFLQYINHYGYLAIFVLVLIQEIGIPTPLPNEILMLFSGYLAFSGTLKLYLVLACIVTADFLGANILFTTFYFFGPYILSHKPKWFPLSTQKINNLSAKVSNGGMWTIFLGRVTPFIRGYISVIVGLLHISPKKYVPVTFITACLVTGTYVTLGYLLGPYWAQVAGKLETVKYVVLTVVLLLAAFFIFRHYQRKKLKNAAEPAQP